MAPPETVRHSLASSTVTIDIAIRAEADWFVTRVRSSAEIWDFCAHNPGDLADGMLVHTSYRGRSDIRCDWTTTGAHS